LARLKGPTMFRACDQCRARKVKCILDVMACKSCKLSELQCTNRDPIQKRGPKPKHPMLAPSFSVNFTQTSGSPSPTLDEELISYFLCHHNKRFGGILDQKMLFRLRDGEPTLSETFMFFSICTISAAVSMFGSHHPVTWYYAQHTLCLVEMPLKYRDELYYKK
ncbi:hypothetical protein L0F63_006613, partial [Massospora cicadina]